MTKQTEAHELIRELEDEAQCNPDDYRCKAAAELLRLEAANAELLDALEGVTDELLDVLYNINNDRIPFDGDEFHERLEAGKAAIKKHGGAA